MSVVVFGSINMDLVVQVPRLPTAGETLTGHGFFTAGGGKGANQAVACARLGAATRMIGRVGGDVFGAALREGLAGDGVDVRGVTVDDAAPSGVAVIAVDARAENTIVVVPGANGALSEADLGRLDEALADATTLLLQLEVPLEQVVAAARRGRARGVTVVLDPAPAQPLPAELYGLVDVLTPNQSEAALLTDLEVTDAASAARAAAVLLERGVGRVIVKLGEHGALVATIAGTDQVRPFAIKAVDTVAAGDAFNGGLAAALDAGQPWPEALRWAAAAGALATTRAGAQPAMPTLAELQALMGGA